MGRWVLLKHTLPDRSWHYDWMIQRPDGAALATFRVERRPDEADVAALEAERIADHRIDYLQLEGPLSEGRGVVRRVASGEGEILEDGPERIRVAMRGRGVWVGRRHESRPRLYAFRLSPEHGFGHTGGSGNMGEETGADREP